MLTNRATKLVSPLWFTFISTFLSLTSIRAVKVMFRDASRPLRPGVVYMAENKFYISTAKAIKQEVRHEQSGVLELLFLGDLLGN